MASHKYDETRHGPDHLDAHASASRWRHQESTSFAQHAIPRDPTNRHSSHDLADFLNSSRVEAPASTAKTPRHQPIIQNPIAEDDVSQDGVLEVKCGPLLNYRRMENDTWFGSVLIVTKGGGLYERPAPVLVLKTGPPGIKISDQETSNDTDYGTVNGVDYSSFQDPAAPGKLEDASNGEIHLKDTQITATKLYSDPRHTFWRFDLEISQHNTEIRCEYTIPGLTFTGEKSDHQTFFIPAIQDSMRIMFHSCNGFSVGTDEEAWSGPCLWNDVMRVHKVTPFHVMLGGGDQIYNDGIRVGGPLREWTDIPIPKKRRNYPFNEDLRKKCDEYYVNNYIRWYGTEPFASANGQIPQLNLWDDHDIIDGFGSYTHDFMTCAVFRGIGGVANKYYLLFQHHLAPPATSFTSDVATPSASKSRPASTKSRPNTASPQEVQQVTSKNTAEDIQLENTFVLQEKSIDSSYIIGAKPGPYVVDHSRSIYARLGARVAFFGIDARTERTRHQVNYPETYTIIFDRLKKELSAAAESSSPIKHLIVLLGIPIAYPRLTWLENVFSSPLIAPLKLLNKRFGFGGSVFNKFDGSVDLLDDLDDHYTARTHKKERMFIVHELQALASKFSVRISILGGDVHLAAVGRFYSSPKLEIPIENDHRYMVNIISSAIVNKPPPQMVANLLAKRNKIHKLDHETDETLLKFFDQDPGNTNKTAKSNYVTMPSRNWAMITENYRPVSQNGANGHDLNGASSNDESNKSFKVKDGHEWLHTGEKNCGTAHKAADFEKHGKATDGSLDVCIQVEMDQHDPEGKTRPYGMTVPLLTYDGTAEIHLRKRDNVPGAVSEAVAGNGVVQV